MKRLLILFCTALCGVAGWHLGCFQRGEQARTIAAPVAESNAAQAQARHLNGKPDSHEVRAWVARLIAEVGSADDQNLAARLVSEFEDLQGEQYKEAIIGFFSSDKMGSNSLEAATLLAGLWAERDPPAARTWLLGLKDFNNYFAGEILDTSARVDPRGMCEWLQMHKEELKSEDMTREAGRAVAEAALQLDSEEPFRVLDELRLDEALPNSREEIYRLLDERDPASAAVRALSEPNQSRRSDFITDAVRHWAWRDPIAARAWAEQLPDPLLTDTALAAIGNALSFGDPRRGADFLATIPQTDKARETLLNTVSWWAICDLPAALDWAVTLEDESLGRWVFASISQPSDEPAIAELPADRRVRAEQWWREIQQAAPRAEKGKPQTR